MDSEELTERKVQGFMTLYHSGATPAELSTMIPPGSYIVENDDDFSWSNTNNLQVINISTRWGVDDFSSIPVPQRIDSYQTFTALPYDFVIEVGGETYRFSPKASSGSRRMMDDGMIHWEIKFKSNSGAGKCHIKIFATGKDPFEI